MDNQQEGYRMQYDGPNNVLPQSTTHPSREAHKKYMEAITKMKTTMKPPICITFRETIACEDKTKLSEDHPFKSSKYIFEYIKKGMPHVQIVLDEEHPNYKEN
ncbi:hypothetical protein VPH35_120970 [Triticum aestivum]